eukprot:scaffold1329_cov31-Phaeocystis_antarctica.AAC.2
MAAAPPCRARPTARAPAPLSVTRQRVLRVGGRRLQAAGLASPPQPSGRRGVAQPGAFCGPRGMPLGGRLKRGRRQVAAHTLRPSAAVLVRKPGRAVRAHGLGNSSLAHDD